MNVEEFENRFIKDPERKKDPAQRKIWHEVFDGATIDALWKLALKKQLTKLQYCVSTGKEGNVFLGYSNGEPRAYKIYRIDTSDFREMWKYVEGDRRFEKVRKRKRELVMAWCKKEFKNLEIAKRAKCRMPKPFTCHKNVLVTSFIGTNGAAAPLLKNVELKHPEKIFKMVVQDLRKLYKAKLVHADVSEFNIMFWKGKPWLIDIGQGVLVSHPHAQEFLERDVLNLCNYFRRLGVETDPKATLQDIVK